MYFIHRALKNIYQGLDLVNIHLFHDASNLIAVNSSPSIYSANRKKALRYVINRWDQISDNPSNPIPFFLFGDFNFRLDTLTLVQVWMDIVSNNTQLLKYDKEITSFHDVIREEDITFPPSYPYIEDSNQPKQYMNTRCPAWCDRILMSHTAHDLINRVSWTCIFSAMWS
ncbi:hypothetical protein GOODEAATRI_001078 [Goodea atripinnis]|uniref:inositol-polyphosphate 5-phosphatase n=1 Tax=Goodea atripinnis TaxID=208336 RepID=A0ABV0P0E5_9TELE